MHAHGGGQFQTNEETAMLLSHFKATRPMEAAEVSYTFGNSKTRLVFLILYIFSRGSGGRPLVGQ